MNEYEIFFEIFNKKMRTTVCASSEEEAKEMIRDEISFNKIVKNREISPPKKLDLDNGNIMDFFGGVFKFK